MKVSPYALAYAIACACGLMLPGTVSAESADAPDETPAAVMSNDSACGCDQTDYDCDQTLCDCDCDCGPTWTFRVGTMIMKRNDPNGFPIFSAGIGGATLIDAANYNFNYRAGVDVQAIRNINDQWGVDFRYFSIDSWTADQTNALVPVSILNNAAPVLFNNFTTAGSVYGTNLYSTELNLRHNGEWLTTFAGYRYVELNEDLNASLGPVPTLYRESVDNRMHGFQIGAEADLWNNGGRFRLESWTKAGIYYDFIRHGSQIELPPGNPVFSPVNQRDNSTAFLGEIGLVGVYQLTDSIALRGGYQLLWIDGVALSSEQVQASNFATGTGTDVRGDVFFHGFLAGAEARW
jgi:hypothetical protein